MSHIHSTENLVFERLQQQQRERKQMRQPVRLSRPRLSRSRHLVGNLGTFFITMGTKLRQVEQGTKPVV